MGVQTSPKRLSLMLIALAVAAVLVITDQRDTGVVGAVSGTGVGTSRNPADGRSSGLPDARPPAAGTVKTSAQPIQAIPALRERVRTPPEGNPFAIHDWNPPPPPPPVAAAPRPVPPTFGYVVLGKQFSAGKWEVFLGQRERTLIVRAGDAIDGIFTVESIVPPVMTLSVAQFAERQQVAIGGEQ